MLQLLRKPCFLEQLELTADEVLIVLKSKTHGEKINWHRAKFIYLAAAAPECPCLNAFGKMIFSHYKNLFT